MSLHSDLLKQAHFLATKETVHPKQASLRRSISASYYSLFHLLVYEATRMLISRRNRDDLRECHSRAFNHNQMNKFCRSVTVGDFPQMSLISFGCDNLDTRLRNIASAFTELQEQRHEADYNAYQDIDRSDALQCHNQAKDAFSNWKSLRGTPQADAFLTCLIMEKQIKDGGARSR